MNPSQASSSTRFRVGLFTVLGLALIGALTVYVNDKPFWWRPCQLVHINVEDATGLKTKSPIRSLGLQIGYLRNVELYETYVRLGICVTAPVEVLPSTRAFIRADGFLGDKFVELKPVRFIGPRSSASPQPEKRPTPRASVLQGTVEGMAKLSEWLIPSAYAEVERKAPPVEGAPNRNREIPVGEEGQDVQAVVDRVDGLVKEVTTLTNNLKQAINPQELRQTMQQLNRTLENANRTFAPEGGLNTTAQRTLAKLEDAIEQLRDQMTRINKGEGSVGMVLNDPEYAQQLHEALKNINRFLGKAGGIRFLVDIGADYLTIYNDGRGYGRLAIWPEKDRYYLVGIASDPRGKRTEIVTESISGGVAYPVLRTVRTEPNAFVFTAMLGKVLWRRLDLSAGVLHADGAVSIALRLGPHDREEMLQIRSDTYARSGVGLDERLTLTAKPFTARSPLLGPLYVKVGVEGFNATGNKIAYYVGGGLTFDDEDIKLLFAFR